MSKRDLGNLGESEFEKWCSHKGITVNRSINDKKGWDFFIQESPKDIEKPNLESLVQVKSTESEKIKIPIKLTNWKNLATTSLPSFFLVLKYGIDENPERAFLIHVDKNLIIRTLTTLRQIKVKNQTHRISKRTHQIPMKKAIELQKPFSENFAIEIKKIIGDPIKYQEEKQQIIKHSGVGNLRKVIISSNFVKGKPEEILDWLLGLKKIKVDSIEEYSVRFGIEKKESSKEINKEIKVPINPHFHLDLFIQGEQISQTAKIPVILKNATVKDQSKFLVRGSGIEILYHFDKQRLVSGKVKFEPFNINAVCNLKKIIPKIKFEKLLQTLTIEKDLIQFYLSSTDKKVPFIKLHPNSFLPSQERQEYIHALIQFNDIIESINLTNDIDVDPRYIFENRESINSTYNILVRQYEYEAKFDETVEIPLEFDVPLIRGFFTGIDYVYIIGIARFNGADRKGKCECCGRNKVFSTTFKILKKEIINSNDNDEIKEVWDKSIFEALKDCSDKLVYDESIDLKGFNDSIIAQNKFGISYE